MKYLHWLHKREKRRREAIPLTNEPAPADDPGAMLLVQDCSPSKK